MKLMLVCSSGGHFKALYQLQPFWGTHETTWVTFRTPTTEATLSDQAVIWAFHPTNRNIPNLVRNLFLAWKTLLKERPDAVISSGAGVAVPFLVLARFLGCRTIFIESITRVNDLSLSAKLCVPFLSTLYVHWPQLKERYPYAQLIDASETETPSFSMNSVPFS